jgi:hypothetical protein
MLSNDFWHGFAVGAGLVFLIGFVGALIFRARANAK